MPIIGQRKEKKKKKKGITSCVNMSIMFVFSGQTLRNRVLFVSAEALGGRRGGRSVLVSINTAVLVVYRPLFCKTVVISCACRKRKISLPDGKRIIEFNDRFFSLHKNQY